MKRSILLSLCFWLTSVGLSQSLITRNYNYIYNPSHEVTFQMKLVRSNNNCTVIFTVAFNNGLFQASDYVVEFETRSSLSDKEGVKVSVPPDTLLSAKRALSGRFNFILTSNKILVARVTKKVANEYYFFWEYIPGQNSPYLVAESTLVSRPFITSASSVRIGGFTSEKLITSIYYDDFPAAAPPFSTRQARVSGFIKPDSIFEISPSREYNFVPTGLYLVQEDTSSTQGLAFRKQNDYPKLVTIEGLMGPLIYICTRQEYDRLKKSEGVKKKFDQVILSITGDAERAKIFMRNFFTRVELANLYFSSYKEGWKTDRGMIFIIYGLPDSVYLFGGREVWEYKNDIVKETFEFNLSATVFDPNNFVLVRDKKFEESWYRSIDLVRKSRF